MPVFIHHIATAVPETAYSQEETGEALLRQLDPQSKGARVMRRVYRHSGIEKRHSVIRDLLPSAGEGLFFESSNGAFKYPPTGARNEVYAREARVLFSKVADSLLRECTEFKKADVTHVITVSCTGFFAPGPDFFIVKDLGLAADVKRFHVGFMGCYAAFPALKMAKAFCEAEPGSVVLVVCLELCSLHINPSEKIDDILAGSVFADGASGVIVSAREPRNGQVLRLESLNSTVAPDSEDDMAWTIGDKGFDMVLSTYVPRILEANVAGIVKALLQSGSRSKSEIEHWAIHPGGRAILDKVEQGLGLDDGDLEASRTVLREYGNMSSATILFVLKQILQGEKSDEDEPILAMAFGPGLTVESALMTRL